MKGKPTEDLCAFPAGPFEVVLEAAGAKKIGVIKLVREMTGLGLKEAKAIVDGPPQVVLATTELDAEKATRQFAAAGAAARVTLPGPGGGQALGWRPPGRVAVATGARCLHCGAWTSGARCDNCGAPL